MVNRPLSLAVIICLLLLAGFAWAQDRSELDRKLLDAAKSGKAGDAESLLQKGADVNARDDFGWTPLILASKEGHTKVVELLLKKGVDPNVSNAWGWFPISWAAFQGHKDVVKLLLEHGADPNAKSEHGWTALSLASEMTLIAGQKK